MPKEEEKTVDIDTSGPDVDIKLPEDKKNESEIEVQDEKTTQDSDKPADTSEKSDESVDVRDSKDDKEPSETKQDEKLEEYSEGVKKRISKLTRKWREAERQKDAAID